MRRRHSIGIAILLNFHSARLYFYRSIFVLGLLIYFLYKREIFLDSFLSFAIALIMTALFFVEEWMCYKRGEGINLFYISSIMPIAAQNITVVKFLRIFLVFIFVYMFFTNVKNNVCYLLHRIVNSEVVVKKYIVEPFYSYSARGHRTPWHIRVMNGDDYESKGEVIDVYSNQYNQLQAQLQGHKTVEVEIVGEKSTFGISFPKNFPFKSIKTEGYDNVDR